jgi:2-keto-4-pentenoate hydratase/2-oxohepta-3-ene-1,7-dioic acid hydratase in catechol pathway
MRRGAKVAFAEGEVRDAADRLIATAQGAWHLWDHRPGERRAHPRPYVTMRGTGERVHVGKVLAVGRNYAEHIAEMGAPASSPPVLFLKPATAIVHDGEHVVLPPGEGPVHHEVEMVVVIGTPGRAIPETEALEHVLGYDVRSRLRRRAARRGRGRHRACDRTVREQRRAPAREHVADDP